MFVNKKILLFLIALFYTGFVFAGEYDIVYKTVDNKELHMIIRTPDKMKKRSKLPAVIFYHGGGWVSGSLNAFEKQSEYLTNRGLVTVCVQYRLAKNGDTPVECLKDAKSALRYIKANAAEYNINPDKIILGGGSAGGHLATAAVLCPKFNEETDDLSISTDVSALVLFNPVICNGPETSGAWQGWGYDKVADYYKDISPMYNIVKGVPPMIFMVGDSDKLVPTAVAKEFKRLVEEADSSCELHIYENFGHSFFNIKDDDARGFYLTLCHLDNFLVKHGFLKGKERVAQWLNSQDMEYKF